MYFVDFPLEIITSIQEVDLDTLKCHEEVVGNRLSSFIDYLKTLDGDILMSSIIICDETMIIIDGHHRYFTLKKLGFNKYYEHINFIKDKLGLKPPIISQELEETLCNFFMEIQYPYAKHCPDYRVNFLHYYYVLYKLFELLGENHYLREIPMLKDREKLIEQDTIWKHICDELNWEFIPSV